MKVPVKWYRRIASMGGKATGPSKRRGDHEFYANLSRQRRKCSNQWIVKAEKQKGKSEVQQP